MARVEYMNVTTDVITGKPATFRAKVHRDPKGFSPLLSVNYKGKVYHLALNDWRDSLYSPDGGFHTVGEPYESRRSASAKRAASRGKMAAWEQRAFDDAVLKVVGSWGSGGASVSLLVDDLFNNRSFQFTNGMAEAYGAAGAALTDAADRLHYAKGARLSAVKSSLSRLEKRGKVVWFWGCGARKDGEAKTYCLKEYDR